MLAERFVAIVGMVGHVSGKMENNEAIESSLTG